MTQKYQNNEQDRRICTLETKMDSVFDHIATTNSEMGTVKTDVAWIKRFFWVIATASTGALITGIINLLIKK